MGLVLLPTLSFFPILLLGHGSIEFSGVGKRKKERKYIYIDDQRKIKINKNNNNNNQNKEKEKRKRKPRDIQVTKYADVFLFQHPKLKFEERDIHPILPIIKTVFFSFLSYHKYYFL